MKIGIYDPYLDDLGGGEKYMMTLATCLSKDNDVYVFWDNPEEVEPLRQRFALDISKIKFYPNIFSAKFGFIRKILETKKFDVIIILSDGSIPLSLSKKTFLHIQQPLPFLKQNVFSSLKLKRINAVFCNSEFTKQFVDKELGVKSKVLYPPVDLKPEEVKKENIILHVGRFRVKDVLANGSKPVGDFKKQSDMVNAFKQMIDRGLKEWKFVVATSVKDDEMNLFEILKKESEGYPIEFYVNKTNRQLWTYYNKAKIYWHATGLGDDLGINPQLAEHFGISTVEAMGAGCVPVVINAGGQKEIIQDGLNGILWNTAEELIAKTLELISDEQLLSRLSKQAITRASYFAGDRFCREAKEIIL